jgi:hypothetical protein
VHDYDSAGDGDLCCHDRVGNSCAPDKKPIASRARVNRCMGRGVKRSKSSTAWGEARTKMLRRSKRR